MKEHLEGYYNLTHPQKRIWYIEKINTNSQLHNIGGCMKINEKIDIKCMEKAFNIIIKNNEGLRLRFTEIENEPFQYVEEYQYENIDFIDFSNYENPEEQRKSWLKGLFEKSFELNNSRLYYFCMYKVSEKEYGALIKIHHGICDGWSVTLIQNQLCEIYSKLMNNEDISTDEFHSYIEFIKEEQEYINSDRFIKNKNFWKERFQELPEEFLYNTSTSLEGGRSCFYIDSALSKKIKGFTNDKKYSLSTFFTAVTLIYINKSINKKDLVIGMPVFNRTNKSQKGMVGMFTSTLPFRFKLDTELNIENLIKQINRELKLSLVNQRYPYDLLVQDLELNKAGYDSLFKMSVNYYNSKYASEINGVKTEIEEYYCGNQSYSLQLIVKELEQEKIELNFDYKTLEYTENQIKVMYETIINIIKQIIRDESITINDIKLINEEERNYKIYDLNDTACAYPKKTVYELFEAQAKKIPHKVAVELKDGIITYEELNEKANQMANFLLEKGVHKQSIVAIMVTHSAELLISILGVLKAGAAYLPIDAGYPIERVNYMLEDSKSSLLLINFKWEEAVNFNGKIIDVREIELSLYSKEVSAKAGELSDLAYIIYTSGSTGKPKGAMIEHQGLTNYICWANKVYLKGDKEVMALYSSISFDLTVTSIFTPLISGNRILIYESDEREFVLYRILRENKATVVKLTPAHLTLLKDRDNRSSRIKRFIVGGEDLKAALAKEVYNSFGKNIEILNEYGPTETVVGCMIYKYDEEKDKGVSVPIGYPADNVQIYILDNNLEAVPTGFVGEMYISGDGVCRGYLNREELTKERFIENPFIKGKRMYKTGDTARYLANGAIEYIGRIDNQVKIRGHRIEIGEIERYLLENEFIKDAVVAVKEDFSGNKLLNAYVVVRKELADSELKEWLLKFLPKYMIPANFVFMDKLPLTINGKVNHALLPEPIIPEKEFVKYKTPVEKELVKAMEEILGIENISMKDNYYQLGGDSIKAIQIASMLKNRGLELKVKDILACESIEEIAAITEESKQLITVYQEKVQGEIESTPIVEWFLMQSFKNPNRYNQYVLLEYKGALEVNKVRTAVIKLIEQHDGLRINYDRKANKLYYNDKTLNSSSIVKHFDLTQYSFEEQKEKIKNIIDEINAAFNIETGILFNAAIFDLGQERQELLFTAHHLIVDGVSWRIILEDFFTVLKQLESNEDIKLPMKTHSFKAWAEALKEYGRNEFEEEKAYWQSISGQAPAFPSDYHSEEDLMQTAEVMVCELTEDALNDLTTKVHEVYNLELNEALIIALVITLKAFANEKDIVIELERHGREAINDYIDVSRTVGWFTSMYPAYFSIDDKNFESCIKSLKEQYRNIPEKGFNYSILKYLKKELTGRENRHIRFNYLGNFDSLIDKKSLNLSNIKFSLDSSKENALTALIDIDAMIINKKLKLSFTYSRNRFEEETMQRFINSYLDTLRLMLEECADKDYREFTPSDFAAADISQEDLDFLFN